MEPIAEQNLHSGLWNWLESNPRYVQVTGEVTLGDAGRIDLVAKTEDGCHVGFEVKSNVDLSDPEKLVSLYRQLIKYRDSGYLDELYFVGCDVDEFLNGTGVQVGRQEADLYREFGLSLEPGELKEARGKLEQLLSDDYLSAYNSVNPTPHEKRRFGKHFEQFIDMAEKYVGDVSDTEISIEEVVTRLNEMWAYHPEEVGVLEIDMPTNEEAPLQLVDKISITQRRKPKQLKRTFEPSLQTDNEVWVQHHVWKEFGDLREGLLPDKDTKTERRIDVIRFEGGDHPVDILEADGEVIGVEAKDGSLPPSRGDQIIQQLDRYVNSGGLSQIYLAVPVSAEEAAIDVLEAEVSESISLNSRFGTDVGDVVGVITVDASGEVEIVKEAAGFELQHDGYRVDRGTDYLRTVGYGKQFVRLPKSYDEIYEMDPIERIKADTPPLDAITREEYSEPVIWPVELVSKLESGSDLTKAETVWKHLLERRDHLYKQYVQGVEWENVTAQEREKLAVQIDAVAAELPIEISRSYLQDTLDEMTKQGYTRKEDGKGSWVAGVEGRVKYFLRPLRIVIWERME